jgi:quinoprotein dehydrogenase-associated probable ABC transporter substrate-binding protein
VLKVSNPAALLVSLALTPAGAWGDGELKICADPANLPLSNDRGEGYENKLAAALAHDLGRSVQYVFFPQRMGFVRNTLRMKDVQTQQWKCDLIMGVPDQYQLTATTQPYLHSTYALILAPHTAFESLHTAEDLLKIAPRDLSTIRIGVFSRSPGNDWLLKHALMERAVVYSHQTGDVQESPAGTIERDLSAGKIDVGILWGPMAAMLVMQHGAERWRAVPFEPDPVIRFDYKISMGLRNGEAEWKDTLDAWIAGHGPEINAILKSYQIPVVDAAGHVEM